MNRFGCKTVLMSAVLLWSISTVITPLLAHSVPLLVTCRVILGLGEGIGTYNSSFFFFHLILLPCKQNNCSINIDLFSGLPVIFHLFAHSVPVEERSRAFGYLVAAGSVGQVVASVVSYPTKIKSLTKKSINLS